MRTPRSHSFLLLLLMALSLAATPAAGQVSVGADLVSRYVWRGFDFGESFSIQPTLEYSTGNFAIGTWASYSIAADGSGANEHDLYLGYSAGPLSLGVTDYYFPGPPTESGIPEGARFFNYDGDGEGAHYIEPMISFSGTEAFPLSLTVASVLYNDPEYSTYLEAGYSFVVEDTELGLAVGAVTALSGEGPDGSGFYGTTSDFALTNVSLSAGRSIPITDTFSLPVGVSFVLNPDLERTYLVFGISL